MENEPNQNLSSICFIVYNGQINPPIISRYSENCFKSISLTQYHRGFWIFYLDSDTNIDENIELHISQSNSPTKFYIFSLSSLTAFKFIDVTQTTELISFPEFNSFFTSAIFNHKINFSFNFSDPLKNINLFLSSFSNNKNSYCVKKPKEDLYFTNNSFDKNDEYLIWALLYISCQPWYTLFQYNEEFSDLLMKYITKFIKNNFFLDKSELQFSNFLNSRSNCDCNFNFDFDFDFSIIKKKPSSYHKYKSALPFIDTLILLIQSQLGDGIAYLVSIVFSKSEESEDEDMAVTDRFPFNRSASSISSQSIHSSSFSAEGNQNSSFELHQASDQISIEFIPSLNYQENPQLKYENNNFILNELLQLAKNEEDLEKLYLAYLSIATRDTKFSLTKPILLNNGKIAKIFCERLLLTSPTSDNIESDVKFFISHIPHISEVYILLSQGQYFIPFEFLPIVKKFSLFENKPLFTSLVHNSLRNGVSSHFINSYAKVTKSGALFHDDFDLANRIFQPGSILQPDVVCGKFSMMMSGSVALSGSVLVQNCYSPRNAIVLPISGEGAKKAISETAEIEMPVKLKKGVTIGSNSFVSKNARIGAGSKIGSNVYVCENVAIRKGCLIADNEMIPHCFDVPIGFIFKQEVVEFSKKLPQIIRRDRNSSFFFKQLSGFVDLESVVRIDDSLVIILKFLEKFALFPMQCGRQLAENCDKKCFSELDEISLYGIFKLHSLLLAIEFWKTRDNSETSKTENDSKSGKNNENANETENDNKSGRNTENANETENDNKSGKNTENANETENDNKSGRNAENANENENDGKIGNAIAEDIEVTNRKNGGFDTVIFNLADLALNDLIDVEKSSQFLTIDDFLEDENVTTFVFILAQNLHLFVEKGFAEEKMIKTKKFIFEIVDEVIVRMSIFANAERKRTFQVLRKIIELTQEKNDE